MPNPWDVLPSYWTALVAYVQEAGALTSGAENGNNSQPTSELEKNGAQSANSGGSGKFKSWIAGKFNSS